MQEFSFSSRKLKYKKLVKIAWHAFVVHFYIFLLFTIYPQKLQYLKQLHFQDIYYT